MCRYYITHKTALSEKNCSTMTIKAYNKIRRELRELPADKYKTKLRRWLLEKCFYDMKE